MENAATLLYCALEKMKEDGVFHEDRTYTLAPEGSMTILSLLGEGWRIEPVEVQGALTGSGSESLKVLSRGGSTGLPIVSPPEEKPKRKLLGRKKKD